MATGPKQPDPKETTRQASLDAIDKKIVAARTMKKGCTTEDCDDKLDKCLADLAAQSSDIINAAYSAAIGDPDFAKALATIKQATKDMNDVAPNMESATKFVSSLTSFFTAAGKVAPAIKGLG